MRVKVEGGPARFASQHWRGIALVRFDGRRWSSLAMDRKRLYQDENGWFLFPDGRPMQRSQILNYKVLLEPVASDAIFVAGGASAIRGRFSVGSGLGDGPRRNFLLTDTSGSIFNPFPNYSELSYEASSMPPTATPDELRAAGSKYPPEIRAQYLQMPALDPRVSELARQATAAAQIRTTKLWRCKVICKRDTPTRWIRAASVRTIRWRIFFSCAKRDTANILRQR